MKDDRIVAALLCYISRVRVFRYLCFAILVFGTLSCQKKVEQQVQDQMRRAVQADLKREAIQVTDVSGSENSAIAEVNIKTAVRIQKEEGSWNIKEIRLGDGRWESWDRILQAIEQSRRRDTASKLDQITEAILKYSDEKGSVPQVESYRWLIDILSPRYLEPVIRIDSWWNSFSYDSQTPESFVLRSAGPDGRFGTDDDLVRSK